MPKKMFEEKDLPFISHEESSKVAQLSPCESLTRGWSHTFVTARLTAEILLDNPK